MTSVAASSECAEAEVSLDALMAMTLELQQHEEETALRHRQAAALQEAAQAALRKAKMEAVEANRAARRGESNNDNNNIGWVECHRNNNNNNNGNNSYEVVSLEPENPLLDDDRPLRHLVRREVFPWYQRLGHAAYNWVRFLTLAAPFGQGLNMTDVKQPDGYYVRQEFTD